MWKETAKKLNEQHVTYSTDTTFKMDASLKTARSRRKESYMTSERHVKNVLKGRGLTSTRAEVPALPKRA
tara:strand:- start:94 stop:303 length:210 start_codon:yes stop_codon:yes gene_type:complete